MGIIQLVYKIVKWARLPENDLAIYAIIVAIAAGIAALQGAR